MHTSDVALQPELAAARSGTAAGSIATIVVFTATIFLSAFLLFLVQPIIAKMVLPILGGAPAVWNACVVFFQIALLAGYGYAHGVARDPHPRRQVAIHVSLLSLPLAILPFTIESSAMSPPVGNPVLWLLALLAMTIGLPFFALATTASVLQHWFSRTGHPRAHDPYFLYAASNLGSLLALGAYPLAFEPLLTLGEQGRLWSIGYGVFVAMAAMCGWSVWSKPSGLPVDERRSNAVETVTAARRARWTLFAFVPSSLMLAVTTYASTDIAAVPLFWIVPLAVYLLTFVIAFGAHRAAALAVARRAVPLLVVPLVMFMSTAAVAPAIILFTLHLAAFAAIAVLCHGRLAEDRPQAHGLTEFYFWMSFGGMLGGLFNGLAAPLLFTRIVEYPLVLTIACLCVPAVRPLINNPRAVVTVVAAPVAVAGLAAGLLLLGRWSDMSASLLMALFAVPALLVFSQKQHPVRFASGVAAMLITGALVGSETQVVHAERTFFGVYRVTIDQTAGYRALVHGTTLHGMQSLDADAVHEPLSYYHRTGPIGQTLTGVPAAQTARHVGVIGLGVGSLAAYARPGQAWTFYEIDPAVERIARTESYFTHLTTCAGSCRVVLGDARLSLAQPTGPAYDVIVLDAFSSDAIPVHLLTREAVAVYLSRLAPGGVLAFHISNNHLSLAPVVAALAHSHGLVAFEQYDRSGLEIAHKSASRWVVAARALSDLGPLPADPRWVRLQPEPGLALWTDDFSNILAVLRSH